MVHYRRTRTKGYTFFEKLHFYRLEKFSSKIFLKVLDIKKSITYNSKCKGQPATVRDYSGGSHTVLD